MKQNNNALVIVPSSIKPPPQAHELDAAWVLALHYDTEVCFIQARTGYKQKTPDFNMMSKEWELKSPKGDTSLIERSLKRASKQSSSIILDCRNIRATQARVYTIATKKFREQRTIRHLILLFDARTIFELKK